MIKYILAILCSVNMLYAWDGIRLWQDATISTNGANCTKSKSETTKEVKKYLLTNSWATCVDNADRGLMRMENALATCFNSCTILYATNTTYITGVYYYYPQPCTKEHLSDYPKTSENVQAVQWVHEYDSIANIVGNVVTSKWIKYDFPHKKITTITKQEIKIVTTVTTNIVETKDTKCTTCGKR